MGVQLRGSRASQASSEASSEASSSQARSSQASHHTSDVVVIGAGPVGLTAAHLLARHGLDVEVIERRDGPCTDPRAVSLDDEGLRIWQACGLADSLRGDWGGGAEGQTICTYLDAEGRPFMALRQRRSELGHPLAVAIHQGRIEATLLRTACAHPRIRVRHGCIVGCVAGCMAGCVGQRDDSVLVQATMADGSPLTLRTSWVIACDGAASTVRNALGIPWVQDGVGDALDRWWLIANLVDHGAPGHVVIRCGAGCAAVTMPLPHGFRRVEVELPAGDRGAWIDDEREVRRRLRRGWAGADAAPIATRSCRRFKAVVAARWRVGRVFLAGDAAHLTPPFAGQGLCAGLRDVANLTFKIAGVQQGWLPAEALDTYEQERRPHAERMIRLACRLGRLMSPPGRRQAALLHAAVRTVWRIPALGDRWLLRGPAIQPVLSRGLLTRASGTGSSGRYLPQPTVIASDGRPMPLDDLLGPRFACLVLGGEWPAPSNARVLAALRGWQRGRRAGPATVPTHAIGPVLVEDRDFRDPQQVLRRRYGAGSVLLVRPDRMVHSHLPAGWLAARGFASSPARRSACGVDVRSPSRTIVGPGFSGRRSARPEPAPRRPSLLPRSSPRPRPSVAASPTAPIHTW